MKVKVTQDCINNAVRNNSHHCMIADAIHEADEHARYVLVDLQSIRWSDLDKGKRYIAFTPPKAQANLLRFDKGLKVRPFMFTVYPSLIKDVGWQKNHPNSSRKGRKHPATGTKRKPKVIKYREFGIRMFVEA